MTKRIGPLDFYIGRRFIWFRLFGKGLELKAPTDQPIFSERYGYKYPLVSFRGYRVFVLS